MPTKHHNLHCGLPVRLGSGAGLGFYAGEAAVKEGKKVHTAVDNYKARALVDSRIGVLL